MIFRYLHFAYSNYKKTLILENREVFSLSYLQGFSHREISEQMGIAQSTVENHIYLALRQLRAKLSKSELILLLFFIFLQNNSHPLG